MEKNIGCLIDLRFQRADVKQVEAFRGHAVANIDDAMNRTKAADQDIRPMNRTPLLGTAFPLSVAQGDNLMLHKAMDLAQPGDVLVVAAGGGRNRAIVGEIMIRYCQSRGLAGLVVDGCIRDSDAVAEMTFPVYARGISPNGPYKNGPGEIGVPISFGGQVVYPGDIVVGDGDGLLFIRPEDADALAEKVEKIAAMEAKLLSDIAEKGSYERPWVDEKLAQIGCTMHQEG